MWRGRGRMTAGRPVSPAGGGRGHNGRRFGRLHNATRIAIRLVNSLLMATALHSNEKDTQQNCSTRRMWSSCSVLVQGVSILRFKVRADRVQLPSPITRINHQHHYHHHCGGRRCRFQRRRRHRYTTVRYFLL